jgi:hypothetical protein
MKTALVLAACLLTGCAAVGVRVTESQMDQFKPGIATEGDVTAAFGSPTMRMRLADGSTAIYYTYAESRVRPATFIPFIGPLVGGSDSTSTSVSLRFDKNGRLIDTSSTSATYGIGMGGAAGSVSIQPTGQPRQ